MQSTDRTGTALAQSRSWRIARPPCLLETSRPGVFAAGDVRSGSVKRVASLIGGFPDRRHDLVFAADRRLANDTIKNEPPIAIASSRTAIGRSFPPNAFTSRARNSEAATVPAIAPATPAGRSVIEAPFDAPIAAPQSAPLTSRVTKLTGALRLGVFGSLSTTNSPIAATLKMYGVPANPKKASRVFSKCSNLKRAAQLTAAGAVIERSPATMPIRS